MSRTKQVSTSKEKIWWRVLINQIAFIGLHILTCVMIGIFNNGEDLLLFLATLISGVAYTLVYFIIYRPLKPQIEFERYQYWTRFFYSIIWIAISFILIFVLALPEMDKGPLRNFIYDVDNFLYKISGFYWSTEHVMFAFTTFLFANLAYIDGYRKIIYSFGNGLYSPSDRDDSGSSSSSSSSSRSDRTYFKGTDGRTYYSEVPPFDYRNEIFDEDGHSTGAFYRESTGEIYDNDNNVLGYFDSDDQFHENE